MSILVRTTGTAPAAVVAFAVVAFALWTVAAIAAPAPLSAEEPGNMTPGKPAPGKREPVNVEPGKREPERREIGRSVEGRPIEAFRFGPAPGEEAEATLLLYGGIHGGYEWNTVVLTRRLISHFSSGDNGPPEGIRLYIIPVVNPDGLYAVTGGRPMDGVDFSSRPIEQGRLNANGVDLNRNWDNRWEPVADWRSREVDAGDRPFSEPETRALRDFVLETGPDLIISYHSAANGIYYAGKREQWEPALRYARRYSTASGYPIPESSLVGYRITGASTGFFYGKGIPAMVIELAGRSGPEFEENLAGVRAVLELLNL